MIPTYLLDTNILSDLVRHPQGRIANKIGQVGEEQVCTSIIVAAELRFGAVKSQSSRLRYQVEAILDALTILPFEAPADSVYANIHHQLEQAGTPIGPNDLLIAAQTLAQQQILVSANLREFSRVKKLKVENWLDDSIH